MWAFEIFAKFKANILENNAKKWETLLDHCSTLGFSNYVPRNTESQWCKTLKGVPWKPGIIFYPATIRILNIFDGLMLLKSLEKYFD